MINQANDWSLFFICDSSYYFMLNEMGVCENSDQEQINKTRKFIYLYRYLHENNFCYHV